MIAKAGQSLDGRITRPTGESQWITSDAARAHALRLRSRVDAIIVGAETVRRDNPRLTLREANVSQGKLQPWRVVMTRSGALPMDAHLFTDEFKDRTVVLRGVGTGEGADADASPVVAEATCGLTINFNGYFVIVAEAVGAGVGVFIVVRPTRLEVRKTTEGYFRGLSCRSCRCQQCHSDKASCTKKNFFHDQFLL